MVTKIYANLGLTYLGFEQLGPDVIPGVTAVVACTLTRPWPTVTFTSRWLLFVTDEAIFDFSASALQWNG